MKYNKKKKFNLLKMLFYTENYQVFWMKQETLQEFSPAHHAVRLLRKMDPEYQQKRK